jgi:hypothetical protein
MKLDLDTSNLDWSKATVRDYRYIHHLMLMIHERWTKLGMSPSGFPTNASNKAITTSYADVSAIFKMNRYSPGGILSWDQLAAIYHAMIYLGLYVYFNPDNFKEEYYKDGDLRKLPVFDLKDMCRIADFDFFAHPFIPGQPIDYYSKFLLPIKKVLSAYKLISTNVYLLKRYNSRISSSAQAGTSSDESGNLTVFEPQYKTIDGVKRKYEGRDLIEFLSNGQNHIDALKDYYQCFKDNIRFRERYSSRAEPLADTAPSEYFGSTNPVLGYSYKVSYTMMKWTDYNRNRDSEDRIVPSIDEGFIISSYAVGFGNLYKLAYPYPAGLPYKVYLYHTTNAVSWSAKNSGVPSDPKSPRYFNSPWPMIMEVKSGTVPENNEVIEWVELPNWDDLPTDWPYTTKDKKLLDAEIKSYSSGEKYFSVIKTYYKAPFRCEDQYAALYYPLFVFDFSSKFEYL